MVKSDTSSKIGHLTEVLGVEMNVDHNDQDDHNETEDGSEEHFILLSLVNALLPDVVLQSGLLAVGSVSKVDDVGDQSLVNALIVHCLHVQKGLEGLAHTNWR